MINLHNNTITTNKRKLCYLLTIPFLTLTNIPNIIFSYDNDVFAMAVDSSRGNRVYFSKEEDDQLRRLVEANGIKNWSLIAEQMPGRTARQCRERWTNVFAPIKEKWTLEEDVQLSDFHRRFGNNWTVISMLLPDRTRNEVKNRFNSVISKNLTIREVTDFREKMRDYTYKSRSVTNGNWTREDLIRLRELVNQYGNKWTKIKQEGNFTNTTNNMKRITEKMPFLL